VSCIGISAENIFFHEKCKKEVLSGKSNFSRRRKYFRKKEDDRELITIKEKGYIKQNEGYSL
jgi:hypothetical protein